MSRTKKSDSRDRLLSLQEELDNILAEFIKPQHEGFVNQARRKEVPVDVYETKEAIHIRAEVPGMSNDDVNVFLTRDMVVIECKKQSPYPGEKIRFLNLEREFGAFKREVGIPKPVDGRKVNAKVDNGILHIELAKISDRRGQRKKIPVE